MVLVNVVGWMLELLVVVGFLLMICVRDDPLVVGWLCSGHSVPSGLVSGQSLVGCAQSSP
jgi:hypothetical protein